MKMHGVRSYPQVERPHCALFALTVTEPPQKVGIQSSGHLRELRRAAATGPQRTENAAAFRAITCKQQAGGVF